MTECTLHRRPIWATFWEGSNNRYARDLRGVPHVERKKMVSASTHVKAASDNTRSL